MLSPCSPLAAVRAYKWNEKRIVTRPRCSHVALGASDKDIKACSRPNPSKWRGQKDALFGYFRED